MFKHVMCENALGLVTFCQQILRMRKALYIDVKHNNNKLMDAIDVVKLLVYLLPFLQKQNELYNMTICYSINVSNHGNDNASLLIR